jgi:hypothetical protein
LFFEGLGFAKIHKRNNKSNNKNTIEWRISNLFEQINKSENVQNLETIKIDIT